MCEPGAGVLCLGEGRFALQVAWRDFAGRGGAGRARVITPDTGAFWFFNDANIELAVKVLDGTALNGYYWLFYGGLTNVEHELTATDLYTGVTKTYRNPAGRMASGGDMVAFPEDLSTAGLPSGPRPWESRLASRGASSVPLACGGPAIRRARPGPAEQGSSMAREAC